MKKDIIDKPVDKPLTSSRTTAGNSQAGTKGQDLSEMSLKNFKCFKCNKKGHLAKNCPSNETGGCASRVITTANAQDSDEELWSRVLTSEDVSHPPRTSVTGPTYKVDIAVQGSRPEHYWIMAHRFH